MKANKENYNYFPHAYKNKKQVKWYISTSAQLTLSQRNLTDSCLVWNLMFKMKQHKFQVQNVLFVMLTNAVCIKELFNSVIHSMCFHKTVLVEGHVCCPLHLSHCPPPPMWSLHNLLVLENVHVARSLTTDTQEVKLTSSGSSQIQSSWKE